jgi:hypothetical protein
MEFELRARQMDGLLLEPCPHFFLLWLFWRWGSPFQHRQTFKYPMVAEMTGVLNCTQVLVEIGSQEPLAWAGLSCGIVRITGVSHHCQSSI